MSIVTITKKPVNIQSYSEYEEMSECSSPENSFYAVLGYGMLEILARGKSCHEYLCGLQVALGNQISKAETIAEQRQLSNSLNVFKNLVSLIINPQYSRHQIAN